MATPNTPEPEPKPGGVDVWPLVIADMHERNEVGTAKYGTPLQTDNGRDAMTDAYQESLDLVVYLRQAIEERKVHRDFKIGDEVRIDGYAYRIGVRGGVLVLSLQSKPEDQPIEGALFNGQPVRGRDLPTLYAVQEIGRGLGGALTLRGKYATVLRGVKPGEWGIAPVS